MAHIREFTDGILGETAAILPPRVRWIGHWASVAPLRCLFGEGEKLDVAISEKNVVAILPTGIMPRAPRMIFIPVRPPGPVAREQFVDWTPCDVARLHRFSG